MSQESWDKRWMDNAIQKGSWSKDRSRKVGAVIIDKDNVEVSNGWNGFPRNINDEVDDRHQRPAKYLWSEHSERNAIYNAARKGRATEGCKIYQSMYPCAHCARALIQSGITEVITIEPDWADATYAEEFAVTKEMLAEAKVKVRFMQGVNLVRADDLRAKPPSPQAQYMIKGFAIPFVKPLPPHPIREDQLGYEPRDLIENTMAFARCLQKWSVRIFGVTGGALVLGALVAKYVHVPDYAFGVGALMLWFAYIIDKME